MSPRPQSLCLILQCRTLRRRLYMFASGCAGGERLFDSRLTSEDHLWYISVIREMGFDIRGLTAKAIPP